MQMELRAIQLEVGNGNSKHLESFQKKASLPLMSSAESPTPSFTWHSDRRERWTWRRIGFLFAITAGAAFYVGRLSIEPALSVAKQTDPKPEQSAAAAGTVAQRQAAVQSDASKAAPEARDGAKEKPADLLTDTAKTQSTALAERESSSPPVVLINPKTADNASAGDAPKQPVSMTSSKAVANASANTEAQKAANDGSPTAAPGRRQAKLRPSARANMNLPVREDSVVARRGDAYVPPRIPQAAYTEQRGRYDNADGDDDRARFEHRYPDTRYAEDAPPRRAYEGYDYRREYLRPFQDFRDLREYRRFGGYDDDPYAARRPMLRPMFGGRDD